LGGIGRPFRRNDLSTIPPYRCCSTKTSERTMGDTLRTVLHAISDPWAKRRYDAPRDKLKDKLVADLEALIADMKRRREQAERDEIGRTA
jgi:hypothetical protein